MAHHIYAFFVYFHLLLGGDELQVHLGLLLYSLFIVSISVTIVPAPPICYSLWYVSHQPQSNSPSVMPSVGYFTLMIIFCVFYKWPADDDDGHHTSKGATNDTTHSPLTSEIGELK